MFYVLLDVYKRQVNENTLTAEDQVISAASCTTNCLAPMADTLNKDVYKRQILSSPTKNRSRTSCGIFGA